MKAVALLAAPIAIVLALVFAVVVILNPVQPAAGLPSCVPAPAVASSEVRLDTQQRSVAQTIIEVGRELDVPPRGLVVALAAGMQESGLRPLSYGDRDSLGVRHGTSQRHGVRLLSPRCLLQATAGEGSSGRAQEAAATVNGP